MGNRAKPITVKKELLINGVAKPWEEVTPEEKEMFYQAAEKRLNDALRPYGYYVYRKDKQKDQEEQKEVS